MAKTFISFVNDGSFTQKRKHYKLPGRKYSESDGWRNPIIPIMYTTVQIGEPLVKVVICNLDKDAKNYRAVEDDLHMAVPTFTDVEVVKIDLYGLTAIEAFNAIIDTIDDSDEVFACTAYANASMVRLLDAVLHSATRLKGAYIARILDLEGFEIKDALNVFEFDELSSKLRDNPFGLNYIKTVLKEAQA